MQLKIIEEKLKRKQEAKLDKLLKKQENLKMHSELVQSKMQAVKELSTSLNHEVIQKDLQKMQQNLKNRVSITFNLNQYLG